MEKIGSVCIYRWITRSRAVQRSGGVRVGGCSTDDAGVEAETRSFGLEADAGFGYRLMAALHGDPLARVVDKLTDGDDLSTTRVQ